MSSSIWTRCAGSSRARRLAARPWRVVESQYLVATRKLVDTDAEQHVLEELIEGVKPPLEKGRALHYLLATPFRYPPLRHGSRFGTRQERALWYGADEPRTAFAEAAYYRLLFLEGSAAPLAPLVLELSAFQAAVRTEKGIDLTRPPFAAHAAAISSPVSYAASQQLGAEMRAAAVVAFRYRSARDLEGGACLALFSPQGFAAARPTPPQAWHCVATRELVELRKKDVFARTAFAFPRAQFEVAGRLPRPAL